MVRTYDFKKVIFTVGGVQIKGFAPGTGIKVMRDEVAWEKKIGGDGEVTRAKSNSKAGKVTFTLDQASPSNDYLSGLALADEATNAGAVPVAGADLGGSSLFAAVVGWVQKLADGDYSKKSEDRSWTVDTGDIEFFLGGN